MWWDWIAESPCNVGCPDLCVVGCITWVTAWDNDETKKEAYTASRRVINMTTLKKRIYTELVNLNQWFTYGRTWALLPFTALTVAGDVAILMIFFGLPQTPLNMLVLTILIPTSILLLGAVAFKATGTQIDHFMKLWRNPLYMMAWTAEFTAAVMLLEDRGIAVPSYFNKWGVESWSDILLITEYIFDLGEHAQALTMVQNFFKDNKKQKSKLGEPL